MTTPEGERLSQEEPRDSSQRENLTPRTRRARIFRTIGLVGGVVYFGAAGLLLAKTIIEAGVPEDIKDGLKDRFGLNPPPAEPVIPKDKWAVEFYNSFLLETLDKSIESFESWKLFSGVELQPLLEKRQPNEVVKMLENMQKNSLIQGVNILQSAWLLGSSEDRVSISPDLNHVWINHRYYDLQNKFHTQLASSWIEAKMYYLQSELRLSLNRVKEEELGSTYQGMEELQKAMKILEWLRDSNPRIILKEGSFAFFPAYEMVNMARVLKVTADQGYPLPNRIEWCGPRCLENQKALGVAYPLLNVTKLENRASSKAVAHEVAHLIDGSQKFNLRFAGVRGLLNQDSKEHRFRYVSSYAMTNTLEDFAETLAEYVMSGDRFRLLLEEVRLHKPEDYEILKKKYDFMQDVVFHGTEFSSLAEVRDTEEERKTNEFTGIRWSPKTRELEISPNPNASPNQRYTRKTIPVLVGDDFKDIDITLLYFPEENSYKVWISNSELISRIVVGPIGGDERASVSLVTPSRALKSENKGGRVEINPSEIIVYPWDRISFRVDSLSKVEVGQRRTSLMGAILTADTSQPDPRSASPLLDKYNLWIVGGPQEMVDPKTGRVARFWKIEATKIEEPDKGTMKFGWINEEGIGKNIIK